MIIIAIFLLSKVQLTEAKYETHNTSEITPNFAFFIVDVSRQSTSIRLDNIVPRANAYTYTFQVSNFQGLKRANVDLTYSIEIITTTNMPLDYRIFLGDNLSQNEIDSDTFTTDEDGMYYSFTGKDDKFYLLEINVENWKIDMLSEMDEFCLQNEK